MGSLVVKLDNQTVEKLKKRRSYSDIDMFTYRNSNQKDVPMVYDVDAVRQSIRNILMWRVGESVLRPDFGHAIHHSMYSQLDQFGMEKIGSEIQRAIEENEPRVKISNVAVRNKQDGEDNALSVRVAYTVYGDDTDGAKFVEEATILGK